MQNKQAITLVELIVSMTIAILLMASIGVFVSSGMQNLFLQQKSLQNMSDISDFSAELQKTISFANNSGSIKDLSNGIVFKRKKSYDYGGFSYIGTSEEDKLFCNNADLTPTEQKTKHIFIKNFIPFFEQGETTLDKTLTATVGNYTSHQKEHIIKKNGTTIVGKGIFGNTIPESGGSNGTDIYLNSPTGMAIDDNGVLYFSDTLNDRILYIKDDKIYPFLGFDDGLREPTGLYFDSGEKALYIANSGKGEILKMSSKKVSGNQSLFIKFTPQEDLNNISKLSVKFVSTGGSPKLTFPTNITDFTFSSNISQQIDFVHSENNQLNYYFSNYDENLGSQSCTDAGEKIGDAYLDTDGKVKRQVKKCTSNGATPPVYTGGTTTYGSKEDLQLSKHTKYTITVNNISLENDSPSGNYYIELSFTDKSGEIIYSKNFPFLTNGDEKIYTLTDNTLEIVKKDLVYPNGIFGKNSFNQFNTETFSKYTLDKKNDIYLETPIDKLDISNDGTSLWNFIVKYYRNYNCYDTDENKEKIKTYIIKKNIK